MPSAAITAMAMSARRPSSSAPRFAAAKQRLDPAGILNPGVLIDPIGRKIGQTGAMAGYVAAVDGFALGGGFVLAISCDIVVTAPEVRWHLPEVTIGWIPPWGLQALVARVGPVTARRLTWGTQPMDGREAHRLGIADFLATESKPVLDAALDQARQLAALPSTAVASTKQFFAPLVSHSAEADDAWANRLFANDCAHPVAQSTLKRFGVRT
jgi:enoyl-CoA hydratase/carnithine racemase